MAATHDTTSDRPAAPVLWGIWAAAVAILVGSLATGFRLGFGADAELLWQANGARVLLAAGAGAALALSGSMRLAANRVRPLGELEVFAVSAGAASGGFLALELVSSLPVWLAFATGASFGAALFVGAVRTLDRPRRLANLGAGVALGVFIAAAALAGTYARAREDRISAVVSWLVGDVSSASVLGGALVLAAAIALVLAANRSPSSGDSGTPGSETVAWLALGLGIGAAGPIAFVGTFAPRAVRALAPGASFRAHTAAACAAGAATVSAISAASHLLVGGYALPLNVGAGMLAVPVFLSWNRQRLRREVGPMRYAMEVGEIVLIAAATAVAVALVAFLTAIIAVAT